MTDYGLDNWCSIANRGRQLSLHRPIETKSADQPMGSRGSFLWGEDSWGVKLSLTFTQCLDLECIDIYLPNTMWCLDTEATLHLLWEWRHTDRHIKRWKKLFCNNCSMQTRPTAQFQLLGIILIIFLPILQYLVPAWSCPYCLYPNCHLYSDKSDVAIWVLMSDATVNTVIAWFPLAGANSVNLCVLRSCCRIDANLWPEDWFKFPWRFWRDYVTWDEGSLRRYFRVIWENK